MMITTFTLFLTITGTFLWWAILLSPWRAWGTRESLEPLTASQANASLNEITVLIPVRNEAQTIRQTLHGLNSQGSVSYAYYRYRRSIGR